MVLILAGTLAIAPATHAQPSAPALEPPEQSLRMAREIIAIIMPPERRQALFGSIFRNLATQMRGPVLANVTSPELRAILSARFDQMPQRLTPVLDRHLPSMLEATARAYAREFSADDLRQIGAFARSPAGQHYLSRSPALLADPDVAAANRVYMADVMQQAEIERRETAAMINDYLAKHPEARAGIKP